MVGFNSQNARRCREIAKRNARRTNQRSSSGVSGYANILENEPADEKIVKAGKRVKRWAVAVVMPATVASGPKKERSISGMGTAALPRALRRKRTWARSS